MNFVIIETDRLVLKGLSPSDIKYIFDNLSKPEIKELLGHRTEEDYEKEESKHKNGYAAYNRSFLLFLLVDKESELIIGRCGLHNWNKEHKRAEIGYVMEMEDFKRKGLMTEAVKAIIDYGFRELSLNRIEAIVGAGNIPSLKIVESFNFIKEGTMRQQHFADDQYEDSIFFSKLRYEY